MSLAAVQETFEYLGRTDPFWAVLTHRDCKNNRWNRDRFFGIGRAEIQRTIGFLDDLGIAEARRDALDFGCGVGRLSQSLCGHFDSVTGIDISSSMLNVAERHNKHKDKCRYLLNQKNDLKIFKDNSFDFIYSNITLQHIPPACTINYIREFFRVLRPTGIAIFQLPSEQIQRPSSIRCVARHIRNRWIRPIAKRIRFKPIIEMHGIPRKKVEELIRNSGGNIIRVVEDFSAGPGWNSFRYCAEKPTSE